MFKGLIGKKLGMTQVFGEDGSAIPATIIEAGPCFVTQIRTVDRDGYSAVQLGFGEAKAKKLTGGQGWSSGAQQTSTPALPARISLQQSRNKRG